MQVGLSEMKACIEHTGGYVVQVRGWAGAGHAPRQQQQQQH